LALRHLRAWLAGFAVSVSRFIAAVLLLCFAITLRASALAAICSFARRALLASSSVDAARVSGRACSLCWRASRGAQRSAGFLAAVSRVI